MEERTVNNNNLFSHLNKDEALEVIKKVKTMGAIKRQSNKEETEELMAKDCPTKK